MTKLINLCGREMLIQGHVLRIAEPHGDRYRFLGDPEPVIEALRANRMGVDLLTFGQRLAESEPKFSYAVEWDNFAVLRVSTFDNWWTQQLDNKTRNMVRRAEKKGVVVREVPLDDAFVAGIRGIYNECPLRQGRRFPHYGKDLETVRRAEATFLDTSVFVGAFFEDTLIGFAKLVFDETGTQAGLMNIISMVKHRDKAPQNALIAHAVRTCASRGTPYLVYSRFDYGKKRQDSLRDFKVNNGFKRVNTPRYYVPLTPLGWLAFRFGLHHGVGELIPEFVAGKLRDFRYAWYVRKYRPISEAS
jgi:hypothetical protein